MSEGEGKKWERERERLTNNEEERDIEKCRGKQIEYQVKSERVR